jgi:hypothetical protein
MPVRNSQRGAGTLSGIVWLLVIVAIGYACWNAIPPYISHYEIQDKMVEVCRLGASVYPDQKILDMLMKKVGEERLDFIIKSKDFTIQTTATNRRITLQYDREIKILPGFTRMHHFKAEAEQPLAF